MRAEKMENLGEGQKNKRKWAKLGIIKPYFDETGKLVLDPYDLERFWSRVKKAAPDECWNWTAYKIKQGYGQISFGRGMLWTTHRISYMLHTGSIPSGMQVLHTCDNPSCVNPVHLWLGTHKENMEDKSRKGRAMSGNQYWKLCKDHSCRYPERLVRGEAHASARLNNQSVMEIREAWRKGGVTFADLGRKYSVTYHPR